MFCNKDILNCPKHLLKFYRIKSNQIKMSSNKSVAVSTSNKLVYIARIEGKYSERDVCDIIADARVGRAIYVDFTAVKDNSPDAGPNPAFKFYSAFVMMSEWNPIALADLNEHGYIKVWVDSRRTSYFMLRHAKEGSEIPRTKVNIHQLAHYTAELYTRLDVAEKKVEETNAQLEETKAHAKLMDETLATMKAQMEMMKAQMQEMMNLAKPKEEEPKEEEPKVNIYYLQPTNIKTSKDEDVYKVQKLLLPLTESK
jgi:hypothetical protein